MFARIGRLFRGFLSLFISGIEEANPEALMEAARTEFRTKMTQYNVALAKMAGVAERLKSQVKAKADRAQELERRILANHRAGNMDLAGTLARSGPRGGDGAHERGISPKRREVKPAGMTPDAAPGWRRGRSGRGRSRLARRSVIRTQRSHARQARSRSSCACRSRDMARCTGRGRRRIEEAAEKGSARRPEGGSSC